MKRLSFLLFISFFTQSGYALQPEVLSVDFDDVMSIKQKAGFKHYFSMMPRIIFWNPSLVFTLRELWKTLEKEGRAVSLHGASNIIHHLVQKMKREGYADLSYYEPELVIRSVNPKANFDVVHFLQTLKKNGYLLIGATNQDYIQNKAYRKRMKEQGVDLDELFDGIVVTRVNHLNEVNGKPVDATKPYTEVENGIYMINSPDAVKPDASYYDVVKQVGKKLNPEAKRFIHVDDLERNIKGARKVDDFEAIQFKLPAGSARKSTPRQLARALDRYKQKLRILGVDDTFHTEIDHPEAVLAD